LIQFLSKDNKIVESSKILFLKMLWILFKNLLFHFRERQVLELLVSVMV